MAHPKDKITDSKRPFLQTHPWISFKIDVSQIDWLFWEAVGEARSKCRHLSLTPLPPAIAQDFEAVYLAKGVLATTAIEGNTLSEEQARQAVRGELRLPESQEYLGVEIQNVIGAIAQIESSISPTSPPVEITPELLKQFNLWILDNTPDAADEGVVPGAFREDNRVVGSVYKAPEHPDVAFLVDRMCEWLNGPDFLPTTDPRESFLRLLLRAMVAHVYIAWIHPFANGNGRTARLLEFNILTSAGLPSVAAHLFSNHYNQTRTMYYARLRESSGSGGDLRGFLKYALTGFVDQLQAQLDEVHELVFDITWRDYIFRKFDGQETKAPRRQRQLALALPVDDFIPVSTIRELSPQLAVAYDGKGSKTVSRDINRLVELDLVVRDGNSVRARRETLAGLLPRASRGVAIF